MTLRSRSRRRHLAGPLHLEDRITPTAYLATIDPAVNPSGAITELVSIFNTINTDGQPADSLDLLAGKTYEFNFANDLHDGGTALPVIYDPNAIDKVLTINGNGSTFLRPPGAESFRFLR